MPKLQTGPTPLSSTGLLRLVLDNLAAPARLDDHPWTRSAFVERECGFNASLDGRSPGLRLAIAVARLFCRAIPGGPPRRGKRLDTRWGEFGILAARYFAPFLYGRPYPGSLREAWQGIDEAIQLFVFDGSPHASEDERLPYRLVADEPEVAPESTLSDWHRKGVQKLAEAIEARESSLENLALMRSPRRKDRRGRRGVLAASLLALAVIIAAASVWGGLEARRIYDLGMVLREDAAKLQTLAGPSPDLNTLEQAGPALATLRRDFDALQAEAKPWLPAAAWLRWVPAYGGDLASAPQLFELGDLLLQTAEGSYAGAKPVLAALQNGASLDPGKLTRLLAEAGPELVQARGALDRLEKARAELDLSSLSPGVRSRIEGDLDPLLPPLDDGLSAALALPRFLGASSEGPKTYLLLAQNEDELRPTGGFITAAGTVVVQGGEATDPRFQDSGELENWARPYPAAPWQLQEYMNSPVLVLRDSNWFTDFPTAALYAEYLYAYTNSYSVDGVIAFDQHMLVLLLEAAGPIQVEGAGEPISAENVIAFMRLAKTPPAGQPVPEGWTRKGFIENITKALLGKVFSGEVPWQKLAGSLLQGLDERHLLLQVDDPAMAEVLARHGWNGALRPGAGDFLMVADSNIGFNKTNAKVETSLIYDVDLTDPEAPAAQLTVVHRNNSSPEVECIQWIPQRLPGEEQYPVNACYWNYMRLYRPAGTELRDSSPQTVPAGWMILGQAVEPRVDVLDEGIEGIQGFGTLMVVPGGESLSTGFEFSLPAGILQAGQGPNELVYTLKVLKQPGTLAVPLTVRVHLPAGAAVQAASPSGLVQGKDVLFEVGLRTDLEITVRFTPRR